LNRIIAHFFYKRDLDLTLPLGLPAVNL